MTSLRSRKLALIGLDSATLDFFERFISEGRLPNISKVMRNGFVTEAFSALPAGTAMNWATISTGAYVGTHGVTAMAIHQPGDPLNQITSGFFSTQCKAERLWEMGEKNGKKSILLKYPGSWPPTLEKGIQVEGFSEPDWNVFALAPRMLYANYELTSSQKGETCPWKHAVPYVNSIDIKPANNWDDLPDSYSQPLETILRIRPIQGQVKTLHALVLNTSNKGYNQIMIFSEKDPLKLLCTLRKGEWGEWIKLDFNTSHGVTEGAFRYKAVELSRNANQIAIYSSQIFPTTGWTQPDSLAPDLTSRIGPFQELSAVTEPYRYRWVNSTTLLEELEYQVHWLSKTAEYLLSQNDWDMFFTQWHGIDHIDHQFLGGLDPKSPWYLPENEAPCTQMITQTYELADRYVGSLLEQMDDKTFIVITSDHGHLPLRVDFTLFYHINDRFEKAGLLHYSTDTPNGTKEVDWNNTKAFVAQSGYAYVNLKGREPHGIVDDGADYESVRDQILQVVENTRDPASGDPAFELVLKRENAEFLGLSGDRVGDVIFFQKAEYSKPSPPAVRKPDEAIRGLGDHHPFLHSQKFDIGTMRAVTLFSGPGVRKGKQNPRTIQLVDIAPTIATALSLPPPAQSEGRSLGEVFE